MISFDPYKTLGNNPGFNTSSQGYVMGDAQDDPAISLQLESGIVHSKKRLVPGSPVVIAPNTSKVNAGARIYAVDPVNEPTNVVNGFIVSNRAYHSIITPGNPVPTYGDNEAAHFYRTGSGARIPIAVSPALLAAINDSNTEEYNQGYSWDPDNCWLDTYKPATSMPMYTMLTPVTTSNSGTVARRKPTGEVEWLYNQPIVVFQI